MSKNTVGCKSSSSFVEKIKFVIHKFTTLSFSDIKETDKVKHFTQSDKVKLDALPVDLKNRLNALKLAIASDDTALDSFQEVADFIKENRVMLASLRLSSVSETEDFKHFTLAEKLKLACLKCDPGSMPPEMSLLGTNPQVLTRGDVYIEQGATAKDNRNVYLDDNIQIDVTAIDAETEGSYAVVYSVADWEGRISTVNRTVLVEKSTLAPTITLVGDALVQVNINSPYVELGATASDVRDGVVTPTVSGTVNTALAGDYTITYIATDSDGNSATKTRLVQVVGVPTISLVGDSVVTLHVGEKWIDPGAVATDPVNGALIPNGNNSFSANVVKTVTRTYTVPASETSTGQSLNVTRTVHVIRVLNDPYYGLTEVLIEKDGYMYVKDSLNEVGTFDGKLCNADGSAYIPTSTQYAQDGKIDLRNGKYIDTGRVFHPFQSWTRTQRYDQGDGLWSEVKMVHKTNGSTSIYFLDNGVFVLARIWLAPSSYLEATYKIREGLPFTLGSEILDNPTFSVSKNAYTKDDGALGIHWEYDSTSAPAFQEDSVHITSSLAATCYVRTKALELQLLTRYRFAIEVLEATGRLEVRLNAETIMVVNTVGVHVYEFASVTTPITVELRSLDAFETMRVTNASLKRIV